jgi:hypothetical protein
VVDAKVLDHVLALLKSPNPDTQRWACELTGNLARHGSTTPGILKLNPSMQLVSLLGWACIVFSSMPFSWIISDEDYLVRRATYALSQITRWEEGAEGVVDTRALDYVLPLLESPNADIRRWACALTGNLASHESTAPAILQLKPILQLESLLQWVLGIHIHHPG